MEKSTEIVRNASGRSKFKPSHMTLLQERVKVFLQRYQYHRTHLVFLPIRPPLRK